MCEIMFSVVIPTRNREAQLFSAVRSVLNQTFRDFEVIVSDNSDRKVGVDGLKSAVPAWNDSGSCRYYATDEYMHMADHWEYCNVLARGQYVLVLTDRFVMRSNALAVINRCIAESEVDGPDIVVWGVGANYDGALRQLTVPNFSNKVTMVDPREQLKEFLRFSTWFTGGLYFNSLPRGLNSAYRRKLAGEIRERHGRVFPHLSPDYSSAFLFSAYAETLVTLDRPLYISHGEHSTGKTSHIFGLKTFSTDQDPLEGSPLKIDTVVNSVLRDFIAVKTTVAPVLDDIEFDSSGYFLENYREVLNKEHHGSPLDTQAMIEEIEKQVKTLPVDARALVRAGIEVFKQSRPHYLKRLTKKLARRFGVYSLITSASIAKRPDGEVSSIMCDSIDVAATLQTEAFDP